MPFEFRAVTGVDGYDVKPQDCPASWSDEVKQSYCDGYNAAFKKAIDARLKGNVAIAKGITGGIMAIHEILARPDQSGSDQPPSKEVDTDLDNDGDLSAGDARAAKLAAEKRDDDSIEDFLSEINGALAAQFPQSTDGNSTNAVPATSSGSKYWLCETFEDHVIVATSWPGETQYFAIPYSEDNDENIVFGTPIPVEKTWIASDRCKAFVAEMRDEFDDTESEDEDLADTVLDPMHDMQFVGRPLEDAFGDEHVDGDCEIRECRCQNRFAPTGSAMRSALPAGVTYRFDETFTFEERSGMTRTKRVAGKDLSASSFAYVGDASKTETWKFPIFDASHVRNALARWGQAKGIPEGSKAGVLAKIHAAAKKFGITVSDERSAEQIKDAELRARIAEHMLHVGPDFVVTL